MALQHAKCRVSAGARQRCLLHPLLQKESLYCIGLPALKALFSGAVDPKCNPSIRWLLDRRRLSLNPVDQFFHGLHFTACYMFQNGAGMVAAIFDKHLLRINSG